MNDEMIILELEYLKRRLEMLEERLRSRQGSRARTFADLEGYLAGQETTKEEIDAALYRVPDELLRDLE